MDVFVIKLGGNELNRITRRSHNIIFAPENMNQTCRFHGDGNKENCPINCQLLETETSNQNHTYVKSITNLTDIMWKLHIFSDLNLLNNREK